MVPGERIPTRNSHGTGCSLSSAMATVQARVGDWEAALREVKPWLQGRCAQSAAPRRRHRQRPGPSLPPPAAHPGHGPTSRPAPAEGEFAAALCAKGPRPTSRRSTAWTSSGAWPTAPCPRRSSPTTSPRTPSTSTATPGSWPGPPPSRPRRPSSCSGPGRAQNCLEVESELHRTWLSTRPAARTLGPVTKSYVDHLLAASVSGSYGVLVAAVLPCFWLYAEVGATLHGEFLAAGAPAEHPYAAWLRTYADEDFAAATRQAVAYTDAAARAGLGRRTAGHGAGLPAVIALRGRFLRRAAAARLTRGGPAGAGTIGRARFRRSSRQAPGQCTSGAYHGLPTGTSLICGRRQN